MVVSLWQIRPGLANVRLLYLKWARVGHLTAEGAPEGIL